ncbi:MAG: hypothetical protein KDA83_18135 [Planctomycetales bacterium]|nr:hypothetical protein [Planctomycetales bacterium]
MRRRSLLHLACVAFCTLPSQLAAQQLGPNQGGPVLNGQGQAPVIQVPAGQPQVGQPQIGQPQVGPLAPETPQPQILPCPFEPIDAEHEAYLRQLLEYWESSTDQIQRFHCSFTQWEFTVFGPAPDPTTGEHKATTMARGEIKYELPDKGYVDFSAKWNFVAATAEEPDHYVVAPDVELNRFITDGTHTYEFNFAEQIVNKVELPPEMRGRTIADGPIPFIFGAEADKMQARYWIRVVTPPEAATAGEYWLEAFPKFLGDRAEFHHVRVILDGEEFLPIALEVYDADHTDQAPHFSTYKFEDRRKNPNNSLFIIQRRPFYEPSIPSGWQMVERPLISPELPQGQPRVGEGLGPVER